MLRCRPEERFASSRYAEARKWCLSRDQRIDVSQYVDVRKAAEVGKDGRASGDSRSLRR
jgi:hypothetical protein